MTFTKQLYTVLSSLPSHSTSKWFRFPFECARVKMALNSTNVVLLESRLNEVERKINVLLNEVCDIKEKLATAKQFSGPSLSVTDSSTTFKRTASDTGFDHSSKKIKQDFTVRDDYVEVYVDGACENNGRKGARAGVGAWFGDNHPLNISEPVIGRPTNNTAEIQACIAAANVIKANGYTKVKFISDSEFVIKCMTQWIHKWKKNNWKVANGGDVKNKEDLVKLDDILRSLEGVKWEHVRGHTGVRGNEEADRLARAGALRYKM